jgi:hypothetical protein
MRNLTRLILAAAVLAVPATAFAYTINGVIPAGRRTEIIQLLKPLPRVVHFKFSAPSSHPGVGYALNYCIGPASNPCGLRTSRVWVVPEGQSRTGSVRAAAFNTNVLVVSQGTARPVPFSVEVN